MKRFTAALTLLLVASSMVIARNAADLKADLAKIAPAGKKIRLAYIKGGNFTEFPFYASSTVVYVVDSDDGIVRRLYPATGSGTFYNVSITADGSRVLFYNKNTGKLRVTSWDGLTTKEIDVGGEALEYWRNPADGSDWSISYTNGVSRVNIDLPSTRVVIGAGAIASNGGIGLSEDGTKLVGFCYEGCSAPFGIMNTTSLKWTMGPHGGCWCSMSAGSAPRYNHNPSGHQQMCVHDVADQTKFTVYEVAKAITDSLTKKSLNLPAGPANGCGEWATTEGNRFTQHPDFATIMHAQSKVNPILMHLPTMKFVYIEDGLSCGFCGDMDAVFLPGTTVVSNPRFTPRAGLDRGIVTNEAFLPNGRRISATARAEGSRSAAGSNGIVIRRVKGSEGRLVRAID